MRVLIAAAGTGGHINPGIAIANKIMKEQPDSKIIFMGTDRGLENDLVPKAGYELKTIRAYGLGKNPTIDNIKKMVKTFRGMGDARKIVEEFKPDIVVGTGGYICGAAVIAANVNHVPAVLHESNAFPGRAVKMLARRTDSIMVSFKEAIDRIDFAKRVICTGTPIKIKKKYYSNSEKNAIIREAGLNENKPIALIFGGSQGAQKINEAVIGIIENKLNKDYQIMWATGPKQYESIKSELKNNNTDIDNIPDVKIVPYIYNMEEIMNVADLIIARSGAMTITEISNLGKASILIPLPNVSQNHQLYNAKVLEKNGAAKIILNNDLNTDILNKTINEIILNEDVCEQMGQNALKSANYDAEEKIYNEIMRVVNSKNK